MKKSNKKTSLVSLYETWNLTNLGLISLSILTSPFFMFNFHLFIFLLFISSHFVIPSKLHITINKKKNNLIKI
jgi:hypothetical protein